MVNKAENLYNYLKKSITFIFVKYNEEYRAIGTGFFVCVQIEGKDVPLNEIENNYFEIYLVTAKHVIENKNDFHSEIYIRLNKKNQETELLLLKLNKSNVYLHDDETVDIACIICCPNTEIYDYMWIPTIYIPNKETLENKIDVGNEICYTSLFANRNGREYLGKEKNYPVFRFGKISLIPDDKIEINPYDKPVQLTNIYLGEIQSFQGSSGSPVLVQMPRIQPPRTIFFNDPETYLLGIIKGHYNDIRIEKLADYQDNVLQELNNGLSMITPSYLLRDILFSHVVSYSRKKTAQEEGLL